MSSFSIVGDEADWSVFVRTVVSGKPMIFRTRTTSPELHAFAAANVMTRLRCELRPEDQTENGMPASTEALDAYEDKVIEQLKNRSAQTYLIGVVTGEGNRDLFWSGVDGTEIREVVRGMSENPPFVLKFANVAAKEEFLELLTPQEIARPPQGGGFMSRLFGGKG